MNTYISDKFITNWNQEKNLLRRGSVQIRRTFKVEATSLFRLLCPTTELDWLPGWNCDLLHSNSGYSEYNVVFRTNFFGPEELWICTHYEPGKAVEYARYSKDFCGKLDISLIDNCDGTVTGSWVATISALNEDGNQVVAHLGEGKKHLEECIDYLEHYVTTGEMATK